ncbi:LPS export ABC transporter permease LptF [Desulfobotulus sp. H1]|uniref:LPS export ABC transporter permease LptF n=1 Tax=Desulfobotulus pelophilus TaxID=2823377 RepID=A0ABT3N9E8_9BACT|nr:LPS export ABC transporter permease LptF [Desulfobotulus pelophilus]MCW7754091.1 LPS export ABC transporter permease LptF [Desulfobotulus pelophilus]
MRRVDRYFFSQMLLPFVLNILFFTFIFLVTQLLEIADLVVNYGTGLGSVARLLAYAAPFFLQFTIPMAVMMTVLVTFLRMSGDREILALKAGGYTIWRFLPSVVVFCLLAALLTALMTLYGLPWGKLESRQLITRLAMEHGSMALKPMVFNDMFSGVTLYAGEVDRTGGKLGNVFVEDYREEGVGTVMAPEGRLQMDGNTGVALLRLVNGVILRGEDGEKEVHVTAFESYDLTLDLTREKAEAMARKPKDKEEMGFYELRTYTAGLPEGSKRYNAAVIKIHEKFSLPAACLVLGVLVFPLSISSMDRKRSAGLGSGLLVFMLYYTLLTMGWSFGESGMLPPGFAIWLPNIVLGCLAVWLLVRVAAEKPLLPAVLRYGRRKA